MVLLDILCPHRCMACDTPIGEGPAFCPACTASLIRPTGTLCPSCGVSLGGDGPAFPCAGCRRSRPPFEGGVAAFLFGGPLAEAIGRFKTGGVSEFRIWAARELAAVVGRMGGERPDLACGVPPDPVRTFRRGFDPGWLLGSATAERLGLLFRTDLMISGRRPRSQRGLSRPERIEAVVRAVAGGRGIGAVRGRRVLLLDDVRTTGATLTACAALLRGAGATAVRVATLARVE